MNDDIRGIAGRVIFSICVTALVLGAGAAYAEDGLIAPGTEAFKLNLGGITSTNNMGLRLDGNGRTGSDLDLDTLAGADKSTSSVFGSATWRFLPNHRIGVIGFVVDRDRTVKIDRTLEIGDTEIPINTNLSTSAKSSFFIVDYQYSFMRNENMEIAGILGLYGANLKYKFSAANPIVDVNKSTTAPLPVLGLSADFFLSPRWTVTTFGQGLKLKVGDVDGSLYHIGVTTDYMLTRNWGLGLGYQVADLKVDVTKSGFNGHLSWKMDGYFAYVQARF